jgi:uncharacterized heparinase superfamily protein
MRESAPLRRYFDTVRHLRPVQLYGRLRFRLVRAAPDTRPPPRSRAATGSWKSPARPRQSQFDRYRLRFLNLDGDLEQIGWDKPEWPKLWRYNLHYFDDLNAAGAEARTDWHCNLIARWIADNPPGRGTGWEPYPTSLRIVNWIKWALAGSVVSSEFMHSLAVQARWLSRRLEHHLLGNHLFANAKALVFAGLFFDGPEAASWLKTGLSILNEELAEQILPDGAHFELSTMYHSLILEDLLDLINLSGAYADVASLHGLDDNLRGRAQSMRHWLQAMCHPDGDIAFFNDAAFAGARRPAELEAYAVRLGCPVLPPLDRRAVIMKDSGYIRLQIGNAVALLDVARIGSDYLPGHAHADTLSFELSVGAQRMLVNSGTSVYEAGAERLRQRGTAAHNTVVVDGKNSSEVWSSFRVAGRARPFDLETSTNDDCRVACSHDGYRRLRGRPVHRRRWQMDESRLRIIDSIDGGAHQAAARFHFHPDASVTLQASGTAGAAAAPGMDPMRFVIGTGTGRLEASTWHPEFGLAMPAKCLVVTTADGGSDVSFFFGASAAH